MSAEVTQLKGFDESTNKLSQQKIVQTMFEKRMDFKNYIPEWLRRMPSRFSKKQLFYEKVKKVKRSEMCNHVFEVKRGWFNGYKLS